MHQNPNRLVLINLQLISFGKSEIPSEPVDVDPRDITHMRVRGSGVPIKVVAGLNERLQG